MRPRIEIGVPAKVEIDFLARTAIISHTDEMSIDIDEELAGLGVYAETVIMVALKAGKKTSHYFKIGSEWHLASLEDVLLRGVEVPDDGDHIIDPKNYQSDLERMKRHDRS